MHSLVHACKGQKLTSGVLLVALYLIVWNKSLELADLARQLAMEPPGSFVPTSQALGL